MQPNCKHTLIKVPLINSTQSTKTNSKKNQRENDENTHDPELSNLLVDLVKLLPETVELKLA